eukprot:4025160-Amphidinium_carterae.1
MQIQINRVFSTSTFVCIPRGKHSGNVVGRHGRLFGQSFLSRLLLSRLVNALDPPSAQQVLFRLLRSKVRVVAEGDETEKPAAAAGDAKDMEVDSEKKKEGKASRAAKP